MKLLYIITLLSILNISSYSATIKLQNGYIGNVEIIDTTSIYDSTRCEILIKSNKLIRSILKIEIQYIIIDKDSINYSKFKFINEKGDNEIELIILFGVLTGIFIVSLLSYYVFNLKQ